MPHHGQIATDEEVNEAGWAGVWGAVNGAARWGVGSAILGTVLYFTNPIYRNLTFQFKVYLQMSGMTIGSIIEADRRLRDYEKHARRMRRLRKDQLTWKAYEEDYSRGAGAMGGATGGSQPQGASERVVESTPKVVENRTDMKNTAADAAKNR